MMLGTKGSGSVAESGSEKFVTPAHYRAPPPSEQNMANPLRVAFLGKLDAVMLADGWQRGKCDTCGVTFYSMGQRLGNCGSEFCSNQSLCFQAGDAKSPITIEALMKKMRDHFVGDGYTSLDPRPVLHWRGKSGEKQLDESLFTVAVVQMFDEMMFEEKEVDVAKRKIFSWQPAIRLIMRDQISRDKGFYSSFVNVATESVNPTPEEHVADVISWMKFLSEVMEKQNLSMKVYDHVLDWYGRKSPTVHIFFAYKSFELGDSGYHYAFPQSTRQPLVFSDIGFGLERIAWCANKTVRNFDMVGPLTESVNDNIQLMDRTRTLALLIGSNITPSDTPYGMKVRSLVRDLVAADGDALRWHTLVPYYYKFWSYFTKLQLGPTQIREVIRDEVNRQRNGQLAAELKLSISGDDAKAPTYEFVEKCIAGGFGKRIPLDRIEKALGGLKRQ